MSIKELQQELSANFRAIEVFRDDGRVLSSRLGTPNQFSKSRNRQDKLYDILQWVALLFMTGGVRKNVSVAFVLDDTSVTFHIAPYPNANQTNADTALINNFKAATSNALATMEAKKEKYELSSDFDHFRDLAVKYSWPEVWKKILKIRNPSKYKNFGSNNPFTTFETYVGKWSNYQNTYTQCDSANTKKIVDLLIDSFKTLIHSQEPSAKDPKDLIRERSNFMAQVLKHCELIDTSVFMNDTVHMGSEGGDMAWRWVLGNPGVLFFKEVRRHIRRLRMYSAGMTTYLKDGLVQVLPLFRRSKATNNFLQHLQFNWIKYPESTTSSIAAPHPAVTFPGQPTPWVTAHLESFHSTTVHGAAKPKLTSLHTKAATLWKPAEGIQGEVHSEVALISYLMKHGIHIKYNFIGTAKAICFGCQCFLDACQFNKFRYINYYSSAKKIAYDWIIPSVAGAPEERWEKPCLIAVCKQARELSGSALCSHLSN